MKAKVNSTGRLLGLGCIASWLAIQAWPGPGYAHRDSQQNLENARVAADSIGLARSPLDRVNGSKEKAAEVYGGLSGRDSTKARRYWLTALSKGLETMRPNLRRYL